MFLSVEQELSGIWDSNGLWALVGALLGFVSSVLVAHIQKKRAISRLVERLKLEINTSIVPFVEKSISSNDTLPIEFKSPIWDFVAQTSLLLAVSENLYIRIVNIYVAIKEFARNEASGDRSTEKRKDLFKALNDNPIDRSWNEKWLNKWGKYK
ncbi:MAG: hypothetical protein K2K13_03950 [Clostridiales bacterium]|nr:hypothetical protein [Clostridiales bacterium]